MIVVTAFIMFKNTRCYWFPNGNAMHWCYKSIVKYKTVVRDISHHYFYNRSKRH